jgi:hypothetical protein
MKTFPLLLKHDVTLCAIGCYGINCGYSPVPNMVCRYGFTEMHLVWILSLKSLNL